MRAHGLLQKPSGSCTLPCRVRRCCCCRPRCGEGQSPGQGSGHHQGSPPWRPPARIYLQKLWKITSRFLEPMTVRMSSGLGSPGLPEFFLYAGRARACMASILWGLAPAHPPPRPQPGSCPAQERLALNPTHKHGLPCAPWDPRDSPAFVVLWRSRTAPHDCSCPRSHFAPLLTFTQPLTSVCTLAERLSKAPEGPRVRCVRPSGGSRRPCGQGRFALPR